MKRTVKPTYYTLMFIIGCFCVTQVSGVFAQGTPRLSALFPVGGQVNTTVDVSIHGANIDDTHTLIIAGTPGIRGELLAAGGEVDTTHKELFEETCTQCHELRSPSNRSMTPAQWEATVDRMIQEKEVPISPGD